MSEPISRSLPVVAVSAGGADRLRAGHVWVYRSDVVDAGSAPPGGMVEVTEVSAKPAGRRRSLGSAFYSSASEIALRLVSSKPVAAIEPLVRERIRQAVEYRKRFLPDTNAHRVISSEGDFLPGLVVDRYNDILSVQVLTQGFDSEAMRRVVVSELDAELAPAAMVERVDARVRRLEELEEKPSSMLKGTKNITEFELNRVRFRFRAFEGQKTGAFLDQRENYRAAEEYARGEALDVFCYQGGFALHLARSCSQVTGVDSSRPALEAAEENAQLNGREMEWIEANAFDLLRDFADAGRSYDTIVLDPPAFAKSRRHLEAALPAYKELNLRALKMLRPGGVLITCSCSYHVSATDLLGTVQAAALDSHRILRVMENRGQAKDHPTVVGIPETAYLKCLILLVS